jgi:hypothetical protein
MLKSLHRNDTVTTPFVVTKNWNLSNVTNEDSILMEHSGSDGLPVALEYLILLPNYTITASACNIALEQQADDLARYRSGLKLSGIFYPNIDPTNLDGTYQRVVYSQVVNMFYNDYRDPTKIWGLEQIDFDKSKTKRFLSDKFKMFEIPQPVYGEKIIPNTITMVDRTTDNDYIITDDGNCNLFAGTNIFAHQQEIGEFVNTFLSGSSGYCDYYNYTPSASISASFVFVNVKYPSQTAVSNTGVAIIAGTHSVNLISTDGINFNNNLSLSNDYESATFGNGKFLVLGITNITDNTAASNLSIDNTATSWNGDMLFPSGSNLATYGNGIYAYAPYIQAIPMPGAFIGYSTDGMTWITSSFASNLVNWIGYLNDKFIVSSYDFTTNINTMWASYNCVNWTESINFNVTNSVIYGGAYGNGTYLIIGNYSDNIISYPISYTSTDGINWTSGLLPYSSSQFFDDIDYGNGKFVLIGTDMIGNSWLVESNDGISWSSSSISNYGQLNTVKYYGGDTFIITYEPIAS